MKEKILENAINNLKEYGFPGVTKDNIFTDFIYSQFFERMLKENLGKGQDKEINELLKQIKTV